MRSRSKLTTTHHVHAALLPLCLLVGCGGDLGDSTQSAVERAALSSCLPPAPTIIDSRSMGITDVTILRRFQLDRIFGKLISTSSATNTATNLYRRIFDTNNTAGDGYFSDGTHCDDEFDDDGNPALNGYPIQCPRQEAVLADQTAHQPFCKTSGCDPYAPIGIFNRIDNMKKDFSTCGEFRIIYGKRGDVAPPTDNRNYLIFEPQLPNPHPELGAQGCRPVADFWADLSATDGASDRAAKLETFFFTGLPGFLPALHWGNFTTATGQIRADQSMVTTDGQHWQLREYRLERICTGSSCRLATRMVTVKKNPYGPLFNANNHSTLAHSFQDPSNPEGFISQVPNLAINDINKYFIAMADVFNEAQSNSFVDPLDDSTRDTDYLYWFAKGGSSNTFRTAIQNKLTSIGSSLTPDDIIHRAESQSCAGCHQLVAGGVDSKMGGGINWPSSLGFFHVSDTAQVSCESGSCWAISPALRDVFLPGRRAKFEKFLSDTSCSLAPVNLSEIFPGERN